jgi:hypothetical protein
VSAAGLARAIPAFAMDTVEQRRAPCTAHLHKQREQVVDPMRIECIRRLDSIDSDEATVRYAAVACLSSIRHQIDR